MNNKNHLQNIVNDVRYPPVTFKEIFSDVFKPHSKNDLIKKLFVKPSKDNMIADWDKPWLFLWVFGLLTLLTIIFYLGMQSYGYLISFYRILSSMIVPVTLSVLIWEMDICKNISAIDMFLLIIIGGVVGVALGVNVNKIYISSSNQSYLAGITEESVKLVVCILYIILKKRGFYCLDGLAIGAAVAAGFSFMETVGYSYQYGTDVIFKRSFDQLLTGGHVLFTAPFVGALCYRMWGRKFEWRFLTDGQFLLTFAICMMEHAVHNMKFEIMPIFGNMLSVKTLLLAVVGWGILIYMFSIGYRQLSGQSQPVQNSVIYLVSHNSVISLPPSGFVIIGRDNHYNVVVNNSSVSRNHCKLIINGNSTAVEDLNSSNGTYVNNVLIQPNLKTPLNRGDILRLGDEEFQIK